ncbi:4-diphosphocytidyl-2-C-methyl-D-erythritol kinase [Nocardioides sp. JS614]|uniref:4-diphosphocytidyl-2-C-methyl-D-erythritol kinase n=1 Tax=Nocardioides sp. (strain ATCC BAA-499 / JS614) TaxID=196162 RepID=ISPE_NOCSJ|nr:MULTISPECIES: 4-(cytidine 5'-diphospho)-2-C-methyl-D-erythritol kinase [unclassified Nocardioides]A1SNG8.1 RecName: Full=4-diphosphocytidyl-2-C-methyl-D-erythritol kinase; Short=CMK; AltName: Full=4-(cytidine-5'-diphospho)-2-C-methyl-D-erythritol kinase [Nocardioides sp. JS614]ABL83353.1 4-diphosphocytidyl-2-C-methyl-D-erythritol kinase [Nocardioides sp. JS614]
MRAPAKVNLHLGVGAPREDGFHPLVTVYQAVGLYDDVTARAAPDWSVGVGLPDWMDDDAVPLNGANIVDRAADLLAAHHGVERTGELHIAKAIPVAGGMAGGSADAAAALVALDRLWGLDTSDDDLLALAARLGSDVPFALLGGTALGTGRGEVVTPVQDRGTWWWVVVPSDTGLSTPEVYRHFDRMFPDAPSQPVPADALLGAIAAGDTWALADALHNDLEAAAIDLRPELGRLIERGEEAGALRGLVSGSGPTCVFLCGSADHARSLAADLSGAGHPVVLAANGPVAGAHLVSYA